MVIDGRERKERWRDAGDGRDQVQVVEACSVRMLHEEMGRVGVPGGDGQGERKDWGRAS